MLVREPERFEIILSHRPYGFYSARWLFILLEKCASSTFVEVLWKRLFWNPAVIKARYWSPDLPLKRVACHRNPFDRAVSTWWSITHKARKNNLAILDAMGSEDFPAFVRWMVTLHPCSSYSRRSIYCPQTTWLQHIPMSLWLRFEHLNEDFKAAPFSDGLELPVINSSTHAPWQEYYDNETTALVYEWAKGDFEAFGYEPN